jgi:hypothetical protein
MMRYLSQNMIEFFCGIYKYRQHYIPLDERHMTISRKYRSYGIRRLNNFSDVADPDQALTNLLNDLQIRPSESFISADLDAIRGIRNTEVFPSTLVEFASAAPTFSFANTLGPQEDFVRPFVRLQDRVNTYRAITGNAGKQGSGYGPNAWAIPVASFDATPSKGDLIDSLIPNFSTNKAAFQERTDFWAIGEFYLNNNFHPTFVDGKGGIVWEGFYIPDYSTSSNQMRFVTTGMFHVEVDRFNTGSWESYKSIYTPERTIIVAANNNTSATVEIAGNEYKYVAIGDKLTTNNEITIISVTREALTLSAPITAVKDQPLTFEFNVGSDTITDTFDLESTFDIGERLKMRIAWWYPDSVGDPEDRYMLLTRADQYVLFSQFSTTESYTTGPYEITALLDKAVTSYQPVYGDRGSYRTFQTNGVLRSTYTPPSTFSAINKFGSNTATTVSILQGRSFITATSPTLMAQTSIGNIIIHSTPSFNVIPKNTRIKRIPSDNVFSNTRVLTAPLNSSANVSIKVVDHNGLVDYFVTSTSNTMIVVNNTSKLKTGMVCITNFTGPTYRRITGVANTTTFFVDGSVGLSSNNYLFVYSDSGLVDSSKLLFCQGVVGRLLTAQAAAGSTTLTLNSTVGLTNGMRVQYSGSIEPVSEAEITNISGNQVTINVQLSTTIEPGATITFAPGSSTGDKQQCVIPLDLSPPFIGKDYGLDTGGRSIKGVPSANLDVSVLTLSSNTTVVTTANTSDVFNSYVIINGTYKIKARAIT